MYGSKLDIPIEDNMREPKNRPETFKEMIGGMKAYMPDITVELAYLSTDINSSIDYFIILSFFNNVNKVKVYVICSAILYTNKSLAAYIYCKDNFILKDFYDELFADMKTKLKANDFNKIIHEMVNMSMKPEDDNYWKKKKNIHKLVNQFFNADLKTRDTRPKM